MTFKLNDYGSISEENIHPAFPSCHKEEFIKGLPNQ